MHMKQNLDKAREIVRNVLNYRKKNKACYQKKNPTPYEFWESETRSQLRLTDESGSSSEILQKQISSYIDQGCTTYAGELSIGQIPETFALGIEFYLNYIFRLIQVQIPDSDITSAMNTHGSFLDGLTEYSLGNMMCTFKLIFFILYNPETGILYANNDRIMEYMLSDLKSWASIMLLRIKGQYPKLGDPVFSILLNDAIMNAMFVIGTPFIQMQLRSSNRTLCESLNHE